MARDANPAQERALHLFEELPRLVGADPDLIRRGRHFSADVELGIGPQSLAVVIREGRITELTRGPFLLRAFDFAIRAEAETWLELLAPTPRPGFHDLMALSKSGHLRIEGRLQPFMANLQVVKDIVTAPRALTAGRGA